MRMLAMAVAATAGLILAAPAGAQQVRQGDRWVSLPPAGPGTGSVRPDRWGRTIDGRWEAGYRAPGGWGGYRRLGRGSSLPGYWMGQGFRVPDYLSFGLPAPPYGYFWVRYYDDAVLVDGSGRVWDSIGSIGWLGAGAATASSGSYSNSYSYSHSGAGYAPPRAVDPNQYYVPEPEYRGPTYPAPGYSDPIPYPAPQQGYVPPYAPVAPPAYPSQVQVYPAPAPGCIQACAGQAWQGSYGGYAGGSYYGGGYYAGGGTTVIITSPPVVTTTTVIEEEIVEEVVTTTTTYAAPRRVVRKPAPKRVYKPKPRPCSCSCVCR